MNYDEQSKKFYIKVLKYYLFEEKEKIKLSKIWIDNNIFIGI